jgi:hypothetical protein
MQRLSLFSNIIGLVAAASISSLLFTATLI